ncbi:MAG TPA: hypothetical protein IGR64_08285 [Leptolyngbyaceae cyanobacterium M65_K2018_010]|nr:hypothetical protein [Leptolyngbyaceae cyanobacterium M65_K2018_010]
MAMFEPLFCPCCTPALVHAVAQANLTSLSRQMLWLGTGAMAQALGRQVSPPIAPSPDEPHRLAGEL